MVKKGLTAIVLALSLTWAPAAQDAKGVIAEASKAIGADQVKTIQYSGPASEFSFGQAYNPSSPWPVYKNQTYTRTIDFEARALRIERVAEPLDPQRRGGGLPAAAMQTVVVNANTGKPIKYVVNTHPHFDHASGLRTFVAEGATIITHQINKPYFEKVFALPRTLNPDKLSASKNTLTIETMTEKRVLTDGNHVIELHHLANNLHHEGQIMAYLPKEKVLFEADAFLPPAEADAPDVRQPNHINPNQLVTAINRLKLDVETIVPVHYPGDGRVVTMSELTRRAAAQAAFAASR